MASKNKRLEAAKAKLATIVPEREDVDVVVVETDDVAVAETETTILPEEPTPVAPPVSQEDVVIRKHRYDPSHLIVVLADKNPKKLGSAGRDRFAVYHTGMTVKQYMEHKAVGKFAAADLRWDLDRKFIKVVSATEINQYMSIELPMAAE